MAFPLSVAALLFFLAPRPPPTQIHALLSRRRRRRRRRCRCSTRELPLGMAAASEHEQEQEMEEEALQAMPVDDIKEIDPSDSGLSNTSRCFEILLPRRSCPFSVDFCCCSGFGFAGQELLQSAYYSSSS